ncbi:endolytic transglycosylase MltG [Legionella dresdenensis]|uniref:Endolytic murein transglycosylase n=1 Tax=Legionella dresdenensis TaxID=450200 RepID=A0ABV8CC22_9GAMM
MSVRLLKQIVCSLLALLVIGFALYFYRIYYLLNKPMAEGVVDILEIKPSSSANALVQQLFDRNLIYSNQLVLNYIKYKHLANRLKAGVYEIKPNESVIQLLDRIVDGDVLVLAFRIIEGTTQNQVTQNLQQAPYLAFNPDDWKLVQGNYSSPEGLLLADTYHYDGGSDAKKLLQTANKSLLNYLGTSWNNRDPELPYKSSYEMLIAASIIEKETALSEERKIISGVMVNRINKHMPLQMDPTVIYALGPDFKGRLSHPDLAINSPYNTYRYRGLPPTPIAMVGKDAIDAAAHPQKSNYLYYVAKGDGSHEFSTNYRQQLEAISRYLHK